jgi:FkbM family methyltransferase
VKNVLPWYRKAGRRALGTLRPFLAPLLHRLQLRIQTAVGAAFAISPLHDLHRLHHRLDGSEARFNALQLGVDAVRLDAMAAQSGMREQFERVQSRLEGIEARFNTLQLSVDATRLERQATTDALLLRTNLLLQRVAIPLGNDVLVRTPEGFLLTPAEDVALLAALHEGGGRLEAGTVSVMQALLQEGDLVVDVGANIGMTVLAAALRVGPTGHVTAFEPASRVSGLLRRSLALNGLSERVTLHACAAGEATGSARLHLTAITGHSSLLDLPNAAGTEDVEVRTVDDLVGPGRPIRLAKLDAEGFELQVWRGMRRVVEESPELAVLVEFGPTHLRRAGISVEAWLAEFLSPGFTAYEIDEATGQLRLLRPMTELNAVYSLNLLLLRQPPASFPQLSFA